MVRRRCASTGLDLHERWLGVFTFWLLGLGVCLVLFGGCGGDDVAEGPNVTAAGDRVEGQATDNTQPIETTVPPTTVDPGTLPQTEDQPASSGAEADALGRALWDAIVADDPQIAIGTFFPLSAYEQVKDIWNPESDWNSRLVSAFETDISSLHEQLGDSADDAVYTGIEIPGSQAQWIDPGGEYNKIGYWRVYGTNLTYEIDGVEKTMPIYSLISWRGTWYVVHLGPIR